MFWNCGLLVLFVSSNLMLHSADAAVKGRFEDLLSSLDLPSTKCCIPMKNQNGTILVNYGLALIDVVDFDFESGVGDFLFWQRMAWRDFRLKWEPEANQGIKVFRVDEEKIWTPDIVFFNSLDASLRRGKANAVVYSDGNVLHIPPIRQRIRCDVKDDMVYCHFKIGSWTYDGNTLDLGFYEGTKKIDVHDYKSSHKFKIIDNKAGNFTVYYPCCNEPYPYLSWSITMKALKNSSLGITSAPLIMAIALALYQLLVL